MAVLYDVDIPDCPFCSSDVLEVRQVPYTQVRCVTCGALGPQAHDDQVSTALAQWSIRP